MDLRMLTKDQWKQLEAERLRSIAALGGRAGKGKPKTRPEGYYSQIGKISAARRKERQNNEKLEH